MSTQPKCRKLYGYITENMPDRDPSLPKLHFEKNERLNPPSKPFSGTSVYETFDVYSKKKV